MNLFQKFDNYLLHNFPNFWVTKVHIFMPIAILFMLVIYVFNVWLIGYDIKYSFPEAEWGVTLMIIPVIVFIVYWLVIQARYNVEKSGGKLSIPLEYMNFFLYFLMFFVAYILISFIPYTNDVKIQHAATNAELNKDIKNLNLGNLILNNSEVIEEEGNRYKIKYSNFISSYYWVPEQNDETTYEAESSYVEIIKDDYSDNSYYQEKRMTYEDYLNNPIPLNTTNLFILATSNQVEEIVADYIFSYNKYTVNEVIASAKQITENELKGTRQDYNMRYYESNTNDNYRYNSWRNTVSNKVQTLAQLKLKNRGAFQANYGNNETTKVVLAWFLMMALMVWIFKQIHWRDYLYGILALVLTPVISGLLAVFFGVFLRADEEFFFTLVFIAYALAIIFTVKGYFSNYKSRFSIVTAMYLHVWLPVLPLFFYLFLHEVYYRNNYEARRDFGYEEVFYSALIIGLISIGLFKIIYKKMRLLPNHK
ncbi:MAG: hypothetical protein ABF242_11300 [Flavobacteriales bacterium]